MIYRVFSSLPTFKELTFRPHLNVLVADTTELSTDLQTRNRAGKTSFVEIVHFLTGASADPNSLFRNPALIDHSFGMELDIGGHRTTVQRSGSDPSRIEIAGFDATDWPTTPDGTGSISNEGWKSVLGWKWFGLGEPELRYSPTVRNLLPYFVRRDPGGFLSPRKHYQQQSTGDTGLHVVPPRP